MAFKFVLARVQWADINLYSNYYTAYINRLGQRQCLINKPLKHCLTQYQTLLVFMHFMVSNDAKIIVKDLQAARHSKSSGFKVILNLEQVWIQCSQNCFVKGDSKPLQKSTKWRTFDLSKTLPPPQMNIRSLFTLQTSGYAVRVCVSTAIIIIVILPPPPNPQSNGSLFCGPLQSFVTACT